MGRRKQGYITKQSPEFIEFILNNYNINEDTGLIETKIYTSLYVNLGFKGNTLSIPYSHLVWLLRYKIWPKDELHIDHIDDNPLNNKPDNLKEITHIENQAKKRGKGNRNYGSGKYGNGIGIHFDKRDSYFYIRRYLSRGITKDTKKSHNSIPYGRYSTLEQAEQKVKEIIEELKTPFDATKDLFEE